MDIFLTMFLAHGLYPQLLTGNQLSAAEAKDVHQPSRHQLHCLSSLFRLVLPTRDILSRGIRLWGNPFLHFFFETAPWRTRLR